MPNRPTSPLFIICAYEKKYITIYKVRDTVVILEEDPLWGNCVHHHPNTNSKHVEQSHFVLLGFVYLFQLNWLFPYFPQIRLLSGLTSHLMKFFFLIKQYCLNQHVFVCSIRQHIQDLFNDQPCSVSRVHSTLGVGNLGLNTSRGRLDTTTGNPTKLENAKERKNIKQECIQVFLRYESLYGMQYHVEIIRTASGAQ